MTSPVGRPELPGHPAEPGSPAGYAPYAPVPEASYAPAPEAARPTDEEAQRLLDEQAGHHVRPYVIAGGRIQPAHGKFDLISLVVSIRPTAAGEVGLGPEHHAIVRLCAEPQSVAEIAGYLDLPAGTVRVLLGDLLHQGVIKIKEPYPEANMTDNRMYQAVIDGLRAL
jgi:hypothetical protein